MKIKFEIEAKPDELQSLLTSLLGKTISEDDLRKVKMREASYNAAERSARVSQMYVEAHERNQQKRLAQPVSK